MLLLNVLREFILFLLAKHGDLLLLFLIPSG